MRNDGYIWVNSIQTFENARSFFYKTNLDCCEILEKQCINEFVPCSHPRTDYRINFLNNVRYLFKLKRFSSFSRDVETLAEG